MKTEVGNTKEHDWLLDAETLGFSMIQIFKRAFGYYLN